MIKIFVVEDDDLIRDIYREILDFMGYEVIGYATNGEEAIDMFKRFPVKPDLTIMDYRLPLKNGLDAMKEILQCDGSCKVIFASADNTIKDKAMESGAIGFIEKPFNFQKIRDEINKLF